MNVLIDEWILPDLEKRIKSVAQAEMGKDTAAVHFLRYDNKTGVESGSVGYSVTADNLDDIEKSLKSAIVVAQERIAAIAAIRLRCKLSSKAG